MTDKEIKERLETGIPRCTNNYRDFVFSEGIYAYMAGAFPRISISRAFDIVGEIRKEILTRGQEERASA